MEERQGTGEIMPEDLIYEEKISSLRTEVLFVALAILFLALFAWRVMASGFGVIALAFLFFSIFFSFYALNYRVLVIRASADRLHLKFGVFGWTIPWHTMEEAYADQASLWRIGGAGIHFSMFSGRYRAMLNFLEYPRIVVALKEKRGLVREVAFSTERPVEVLGILRASVGRGDGKGLAGGLRQPRLQAPLLERGTLRDPRPSARRRGRSEAWHS